MDFLDKDVVAEFRHMSDQAVIHGDEERAVALIDHLTALEGIQDLAEIEHLRVWAVVQVKAGTEVLDYILRLAAVGSCQCVYTFVFETDNQAIAARAVWYGYRRAPMLYERLQDVLDARIKAHAARL